MMTDDLSMHPLNKNMDSFSFGTLSNALDELDFLSTAATVPRTQKDELSLNGFKIRGVRSASNLNTRRNISHPPHLDVGTITKENMHSSGTEDSSCPYEFDSGHMNSKILQSRAHRARICPYYRRRPLYCVAGRSSSLHQIGSLANRINGCTDPNSDYFYLRSLRSVNSLPRLCEAEGKGRIQAINFQPSSFLFDDGLKRKTEDYCSYPFPVPALTRSKSLEDLRESVKPKLKSLSTDMTSGSVSSFDASLSPRRSQSGGRHFPNGNQSTFPMLYPRRIFDNNGSNSRITSKDMDSMSMLIGKLDVA